MKLFIALLILVPSISWSQPEDTGEETKSGEPPPRETEVPEQDPEPDNLRSRELGAALKNFSPSEEISADNAVSFPVDI